MDWKYKGKSFRTITHFNEIPNIKNLITEDDRFKRYLVYNVKWDKCFWLCAFGIHGNGAQYKASLQDIYTGKHCWCDAKWIEFVKEIK